MAVTTRESAAMVDPWEGWTLTRRILNVLDVAGVHAPDDLAGVSFASLRRLRNMGAWSLQILRDEMARHGMRLVGDTGRIGDSRARTSVPDAPRGYFSPTYRPDPAEEFSSYDAKKFARQAYVSDGGDVPTRGDFVYLLMRGAEVVYAGTTTNLAARVGSHLRDRKPFDHVLWQRTPPDMGYVVERWLIHGLLPPLNRFSRYRRGGGGHG